MSAIAAVIVDKIFRPISERFFYTKDIEPTAPDYNPADYAATDYKTGE